MLKGKKILVGVTASIAAYKAALLIRLLVKEGAEVKVIMTPMAVKFITPLTLATLSKNEVLIDFFIENNGHWNSHVDLGVWADAFVIAPASANTLAKMASGIADNLLLTTYLSARCPVFLAPAMDLDMLKHPSTLKNIETLKSYKNTIIDSETGELASGLDGKGRMSEPNDIVSALIQYFQNKVEKKKPFSKLNGIHILVTAGPTFEPIDPVRYIGNHSSGKMGYAICRILSESGAFVTLVSGPVSIPKPEKLHNFISVNTAEEMFSACQNVFSGVQVAIFSAAVADYRPKEKQNEKIKRIDDDISLQLIKNTDIAFELGKNKKTGQFLVGFALETNNAEENALKKLKSKNLDMIVLNSLQEEGAGFGYDTNKIKILLKDNKVTNFGLKNKNDVAFDIISEICEYL